LVVEKRRKERRKERRRVVNQSLLHQHLPNLKRWEQPGHINLHFEDLI